ncbi:MAG: hypothetical protein F6J93_10530 [Oscillatoria sp. SIO1A7]|nr:hypothetical protein [Oscillatoria sp. SIO1A7]
MTVAFKRPETVGQGLPKRAAARSSVITPPGSRVRKMRSPGKNAIASMEGAAKGREKPRGGVLQSGGIKKITSARQLPFWLGLPVRIASVSTVVTFIFGGAVLAIYGTAVYSQQEWSQQYGKLEKLRREERQLIARNEMLKKNSGDNAEAPESGLEYPASANFVRLPASPPRPFLPGPAVKAPQPFSSNQPLGY